MSLLTRLATSIHKRTFGLCADYADPGYLDPQVPMSTEIGHGHWLDAIVSLANHPGAKVLEIGSREVTGISSARKRFDQAEYIGFDYYPGKNVDVVGDAHQLSNYFQQESFDLIFSSAVFEHLALPWVVSEQIVKLLKVGGYVFSETHYSYSSHERPWHFFQFSEMALKVLFPESMGISCIAAGASNPIVGRFSTLADSELRKKPVSGLYCHSEFLGKKTRHVDNFTWSFEAIRSSIGTTEYPEP